MSDGGEGLMIYTRDVRVDYDDFTAVEGLNLSIGPGEVFGLIGPNGAGKTSTIKVLATLLEPTHGDVSIAGYDIVEYPRKARRVLGYMPDMPPVYDNITCREFLDHFAAAYFVSRRERRARVDACLEDVELTGKRDVMAGTLSRGMKQRLVLAKTLLHDPEVLLLDEPASGMDPIIRMNLRDTLIRLGQMGKAVLISSHILTELSGFCTSVGIMEKGRLVTAGRIEDLVGTMSTSRRIVVELLDHDPKLGEHLQSLEQVSNLAVNNGRTEFDFEGVEKDVSLLLADLVQRGYGVRGYYEKRKDIEDILKAAGAREAS